MSTDTLEVPRFKWDPESHLAKWGVEFPMGYTSTEPLPQTHAGKVVLITGAGDGVGAAHAWQHAMRGALVIVSDINGKKAERVVAAIRAAGFNAEPDYTDVANLEAAQLLVPAIIARHGQLDVLIANAGITRDTPFQKKPWDDFDTLFKIHVQGAVIPAKAAYTHFLERGEGTIITVPSSAATYGNEGQADYAGCKGFMVSFTHTLGAELHYRRTKGDHKIGVYGVCPAALTMMTFPLIKAGKFKKDDWDSPTFDRLAAASTPLYAALSMAGADHPGLCGQLFVRRGYQIQIVNGSQPLVGLRANHILSAEELAERFGDLAKFGKKLGVGAIRSDPAFVFPHI